MRGMIVGRFQPFHLGHLSAIKYILAEADELIIIIAASQQSHQPSNPFTAGERYDMIHRTLIEEFKDISHISIIPANDVKDNGLWVSHLTRLVPKFDMVYTNNPITTYLFKQAGMEVRNTPFYERKEFSANYIRDVMRNKKKEWKMLLPKVVVKIMEEIKGEERIAITNSTDEI